MVAALGLPSSFELETIGRRVEMLVVFKGVIREVLVVLVVALGGLGWWCRVFLLVYRKRF